MSCAPSQTEKQSLRLVTAASPGHFRSLLQFLNSVRRYEPELTCVVYGLELDKARRSALMHRFPRCEYHDFDFGRYPVFFDINRDNGSYAWKPAIIWEALCESRGPVCWMDSGNTLVSPLDGIRHSLDKTGFYSPHSPGTLADWTHPGMYAFLGLPQGWMGDERNLNGACIGFDPRNERALALAREWNEYARDKDCIAPEGAGRDNHRYDQALLSVLAYRAGLAGTSEHGYLGFKLHQDVETRPLRAALRAVKRMAEYWLYRLRTR